MLMTQEQEMLHSILTTEHMEQNHSLSQVWRSFKAQLCWPIMMLSSTKQTGIAFKNQSRVGKRKTHSKLANLALDSIQCIISLVSLFSVFMHVSTKHLGC